MLGAYFIHIHFYNQNQLEEAFYGNPIPVIRIGRGKIHVFYSASIHANESITTNILLKFIEDFCIAYRNNDKIYGYNARDLFARTSIYIVPMCNPDGVNLVNNYYSINSKIYQSTQRIADTYPSIPFPDGWKANIRGIDLNLQFPAGWEEARKIKFAQGFTTPAPRDFVGFRSSYRT